MSKIGFTGTSKGMTAHQKRRVHDLLNVIEGTEFHHGDCIGADAEAHDIAKSLGYKIILHPPENTSKQAFKEGNESWPPKAYLSRNKDIVNETEILIASPNTRKEVIRSGTWSTIRFARKNNRKIFIVYPDGELE